MTLENIKLKINQFHKNGQVINAVYWLLNKYNLNTKNLKGIAFREIAKPDFVLFTTEGDFGTPQTIRIPENTFEFPLELMLTLLAHELVHVAQKTIKPYVLDKNEREWQAYCEMLFNKRYPNVPQISNFHKRFFANKALEYYNRMGENSDLQLKYLSQKLQVESLITTLNKK